MFSFFFEARGVWEEEKEEKGGRQGNCVGLGLVHTHTHKRRSKQGTELRVDSCSQSTVQHGGRICQSCRSSLKMRLLVRHHLRHHRDDRRIPRKLNILNIQISFLRCCCVVVLLSTDIFFAALWLLHSRSKGRAKDMLLFFSLLLVSSLSTT